MTTDHQKVVGLLITMRRFHFLLIVVFTLSIALAALPAERSVAQPQPDAPALNIQADTAGIHVSWAIDRGMEPALQSTEPPAPRLLTLRLPAGADPTPQIVRLASEPWSGALPPPPEVGERILEDGTRYPPLPASDLDPRVFPAMQTTPDAPLTLLRESRLRGARVAVYLLSPLYSSSGNPRLISELEALVPDASLLVGPLELSRAATGFAIAGPPATPPSDRAGWKIRVLQGGIQLLSASELLAVGLNLAAVDVSRLQLRRSDGTEVALEQIPATGTPSELRFYAPAPGDRWNSYDTYWLTLETTSGIRMLSRDARTPAAGAVTTAFERGVWRQNRIYDSRMPGPDSNYFFAEDMRTVPPEAGSPGVPASVVVPINTYLSLAAGARSLTVAGSSIFNETHQLRVSFGGVDQSASWSGEGTWAQSMDFAAGTGSTTIALLPGSVADGVHLDSVSWKLPVQLNFFGLGAEFFTLPNTAYLLSSPPANAALYDVSDPIHPTRLGWDGASFRSNTASDPNALLDHLLVGADTLRMPAITAHQPANLAQPLNAQVIYIAPQTFHAALAPLIDRRRAQGYSVALVSVEAIYDGWSGGQVSPDAIRNFLRYAAGTWSTAPLAVTLVGDGTSDPRNYLGIGQIDWIPPYLASVDRWLGEAACETCYAQLDGASPLDDVLPDLLIGRLPVKSTTELSALVTKIKGYEESRDMGRWRSRMAYITDNADQAGDFAAAAEMSAASQPAGIQIQRVYYAPGSTGGEGNEPDPLRAFQRTMGAFNLGAGVLSFIGHGLQYQWAYTGPPAPGDQRFLLNVDYAGDLVNGVRLPIVLSLTCLTGVFQQPSVRGTTIDEALLLNPHGGAIATWSSAGLGILNGHDALQRGFYNALWAAPPMQAPIGTLTLAGYQELYASSPGCCLEAIRTYGLLGDPLTPARVMPGIGEVNLPLMRK